MTPRLLTTRVLLTTGTLLTTVGVALLVPGPADARPTEAPGHPIASAGLQRLDTLALPGAEIVAHDRVSQQLYVSDAEHAAVHVVAMDNPAALSTRGTVDLSAYGSEVTSVAVTDGVIAAAVKGRDPQAAGALVFFTRGGQVVGSVTVGAGPDAVVVSPDGSTLLVANEGEPSSYCADGVDPDGSVSIVAVPKKGVPQQSDVRTATFTAFDAATLDPSIRIFGPGATVAQDLEPEYIAVGADSRTAWVTLQENNAIATIDVASATVTSLTGLGSKDHSAAGNGLDPSDRDGGIAIARWPVRGLPLPDTIGAFRAGGRDYLVTANEGDAREYDCFEEETRVKDLADEQLPLGVDPALTADAALGRLTVTTATPGTAGSDGRLPALYALGTRSFAVWSTSGALVFDSGDVLEQLTAQRVPELFNSEEGDPGEFDKRSDNKGPEPEGLTVGVVDGKPLAVIGLERTGGLVLVDLSDPASPVVLDYVPTPGDVAPEGLTFVDRPDSPTRRPLLVVANEESDTVSVFGVTR